MGVFQLFVDGESKDMPRKGVHFLACFTTSEPLK